MRKMVLPMNLQFFADGAAGSDADAAAGNESGAQAEAGGAGATEQKSAETETGNAGAAEKTEKQTGNAGDSSPDDVRRLVQEEMKKASMTAEERAKYEADEREKFLKEREEAVSLRERTADAKTLLADNGLPASFASMVIGSNKAETAENVKTFKSQFDMAVQAQVEKRMGGRTPETGSGVSGTGTDKTLEETIYSYL